MDRFFTDVETKGEAVMTRTPNLKQHGLTATITAVLLYFASASAFPQSPALGSTEISVPGAWSAESTELTTMQSRSDDSPFGQLKTIVDKLPTVTVAPDLSLAAQRFGGPITDPPKIGISAGILELNWDGAIQNRFLQVKASGGGTLLGIRIVSPGAVGIRIGLLIEHVPAEVRFSFTSAGASEAILPAVSGEEITRLIDLNLAADGDSEEARTYWSPVVKGEEAVILIHAPEGVDTGELRFTIPRISHIFQDSLSLQSAGWCNLDVSCYPSWSEEARGVARMVFTQNGGTFLCTGTLLNDKDDSGFIPYFLSANHCIASQTVASTLQTFWYYQSASCNDSLLDSRSTTRSGGATLLYASAATDTAFMRLIQQPPVAYFVGWTTAPATVAADVTGIHHPQGDWKKISFGEVLGFLDCSTGSSITCSFASVSTGEFIGVRWSAGTTEGGSSGSALLNSDGQVIASAYAANTSCLNPSGLVAYGRFDIAFEAGLKVWLNGPRFKDVPTTYWAWPHIEAIAVAGITTGCAADRYCPDSLVKRSEMAAFLLRGIHGGSYKPPAPTGQLFSDVPISYWAAGWIEQLATEGITLGCGGGRYCPEATVTRAEMAVFLLRSKYGSDYAPPPATGTRFLDVPKSYWAASWIEKLAVDGITTGCGGGNYCPDNSVTRAEMAVFLARSFNLPLPPRP